MEFLWRPAGKAMGDHLEIFSHFASEPLIDTENAESLLNRIYDQSTAYRVNETANMAILVGGDFSFNNAGDDFPNADSLIKTFNKKFGRAHNIVVKYSTPSTYI